MEGLFTAGHWSSLALLLGLSAARVASKRGLTALWQGGGVVSKIA